MTQEELHGEDQGYPGDPSLENHEVGVIQTDEDDVCAVFRGLQSRVLGYWIECEDSIAELDFD